MHHFRLIMRHAFRETLVESERVAGTAASGVRNRRHVGTRGLCSKRTGKRRRGSGRFRQRKTPGPFVRGSAMAIGTIHLDESIRPAQTRFHMNGMIEFDGGGIETPRANGGEFRMSGAETFYGAAEIYRRTGGLEIGVAACAAGIAGGGQAQDSAVLNVAGRTVGTKNLIGVMNWPVMAGQAGLIAGRGAKSVGGLHMADVAAGIQDGVRRGQASAAINSGVPRESPPGDYGHGKKWKPGGKPETPAAKRMRPQKIVQVNPLGQLFRGAWRSRQRSLSFHPG